jgi:hypothetical protein
MILLWILSEISLTTVASIMVENARNKLDSA